ncbi:hypothetical protein EJB05_28203, partial [Eragrostis curvula]
MGKKRKRKTPLGSLAPPAAAAVAPSATIACPSSLLWSRAEAASQRAQGCKRPSFGSGAEQIRTATNGFFPGGGRGGECRGGGSGGGGGEGDGEGEEGWGAGTGVAGTPLRETDADVLMTSSALPSSFPKTRSRRRGRLRPPIARTWSGCVEVIEMGGKVGCMINHGPWVLLESQSTWSLFFGSLDKTIKVWDLTTLQCIQTLSEHKAVVKSVLWDQKLLSCSLDKTVKVWTLLESRSLEMQHIEEHVSIAFLHLSHWSIILFFCLLLSEVKTSYL